ncbi:hypothetical protein [Nocardia alba]|uniref:Uncharacterized protein n=1 Tax=Nocardia alba TaxID=225051 RepID=A0A4V2P938_9NOCA|nr:hypothetical protein [Nocardia alba]TCJ88125.1 hypothetical protein DFR71_6667 [Nocardia alba]
MNAFERQEAAGGRRAPFVVPSDIRDSAGFMQMMREMPNHVGLTGGQIASYTQLPRSTVYRFLHRDNNTLPKSREQVAKFATVCKLGPGQVGAVLAIWDRLSAEAEEVTPPRLVAIDGGVVTSLETVATHGDVAKAVGKLVIADNTLIGNDNVLITADGRVIAFDEEHADEPAIPHVRESADFADEPGGDRRQDGRRQREQSGRRRRGEAFSPLVRRATLGGDGSRDVFRTARRTMFQLVVAVLLLVGQLHGAEWLPRLDSVPRHSLWVMVIVLAVLSLNHGIEGLSYDRAVPGWVSKFRVPLAGALATFASAAVIAGTKDPILAGGFALLVFAATPSLFEVWSSFFARTTSKSKVSRLELMQYIGVASVGVGATMTALVYSIGVPVPVAVLAGCVIGAMMTLSITSALRTRAKR